MIAFYSMNKIFDFIKRISIFLALPLLSGILVGTSYIPFNGWALLFCYIPLWYKLSQLIENGKSYKQIFFAAWVTQFILTMIGFNWIFYVTTEFGNFHWSIGALAQIAFASFMHLYLPAALTLAALIIRKANVQFILAKYMIMALSVALIERIWPSIFEWNLAYTFLWIKLPLYQWADVVGFWGLSTWMYIWQACLGYAFYIFKSDRKQSLSLTAAVLGVLAGLTLVGHFKGKGWSKTDQKVNVGMAQGNIGNAEKIQSEKKSQFHSHIRGIYTQLTDDLINKSPVDFVVWPETAMPFAFDPAYFNSAEQRELLKTANRWGIPIVTGAYSLNTAEKDILGDPVIRNAVFYVAPNMNYAAPPYYKTNLLAFGEYMPFGEMFPILYKILPFVGVYAKGSGPVIAEVALKDKSIRLGPQICYDSLNPGFSRDLAKNGAQVIYNVTNDSWFGWWAEPFQHQYMTLGRAVEVRRPLVRSTNTGVTSAILADGTVLTESPINQTWAHNFEIKYKKNPALTLYTKFGYMDWIVWLALLIGLVVAYKTPKTKLEGENV